MNRLSLVRLASASFAVLAISPAALVFAQTPAALTPGVLPSVAVAAPGNAVVADVTAGPVLGDAGVPIAATGVSTSALAGLTADSALPEAPSASLEAPVRAATSGEFLFAAGQATPNVAPKLTKYIPSGWTAQHITARDKVLLGLRDLYSPLNFLAMIASAGYEQALNGEPNYGTDRGAFGQRLGAAAIRESTQGLFTDSVLSPIFREDPRYYVRGSGHNFFGRTLYAVTRPIVTRTDGGHSTINAALLVGYAGSSALAYTYYPKINQNFKDTASAYGGSVGGAAIGFFVSEFSDDVLKAVHLRKK